MAKSAIARRSSAHRRWVPEIAEVELVRRQLLELVGDTITQVLAPDPLLDVYDYPEAIVGCRLTAMRRQGKLLGFELDQEMVLACHLRMTGSLVFAAPEKWRARLDFASGRQLFFRDPRRFGSLTLIASADFAAHLAQDLFSWQAGDERGCRALRSSRAVKGIILDQQALVSGVGNYVADEALWRAKIDPSRPGFELRPAQWRRLLTAARQVAEEALQREGMSLRDYQRPDGGLGSMQDVLDCYGRAGQSCRRCRGILVKKTVAGRGTVWCPRCQR